MAYGIFYWASRLSLDSLSSVVLYLGYLFLIALLDFLITGKPLPLWPDPPIELVNRYHWVLGVVLGRS